ncbi:MAG: nucleotidyltransferase domain-containing protein [Candidatus Aminicenantes bacterium]|nr:nucleotidyltransferase domain-containing protein [Candidatus Aminicenantes bacterium]
MARGDYDEESDIDVAIVIRELTPRIKHQILDKSLAAFCSLFCQARRI